MVERGVFTLSLDTELAWGSLRRKDERAFDAAYPRARETALRLLDLLARHRVPATWAIVGHLFLASSDQIPPGEALRAIGERPRVRRGRPGDERSRPLLYASEVVDAIRSCPVPQDIGCHSFAHERADQLSADEFRLDVRACVEVASARGIRLRSYVFPYNVEAHHDVLYEEGFLCYRSGAEPRQGVAAALARARGFAAEALKRTPATVLPTRRPTGIWTIPPSLFFIPRSGRRGLIPLRNRLDRALAGLDAAARERRVFHLWFHPFNLTTDPEGLFGVLDAVLARAAALRDAGRLDVLTMAALAERAAERP